MGKSFVKDIEGLFKIIKNNEINSEEKIKKISVIRENLKLEQLKTLGQYYEENILNTNNTEKSNGIVYTPKEIAEYIVTNTIESDRLIQNPYLKFCDPSCGVGNIIIPLYKKLKNFYNKNLNEINRINNLQLTKESIGFHIIKYNIYGYDLDSFALKILKIDLFYLSKEVSLNIKCKDFLKLKTISMDYFLGNPPYVGHKAIDKDYTKYLKENFKEVYKDKGDIYYCFFLKAIQCVKKYGDINFITSRYFLESLSAKNLREYIKKNTQIKAIIDFYGVRPFKNIGVDPVILFLKKSSKVKSETKIVRPILNKEKIFFKFFQKEKINEEEIAKIFYLDLKNIEGINWSFISNKEKKIIEKIKNKSKVQLKDICESHQGIITGCDKAFVVTKKQYEKHFIEKVLLRPWIKNKDIDKFDVKHEDKYIIYTNFIGEEEHYKNTMSYISPYKSKLENRREVKKGYRKWYNLQWGRDYKIFEGKKIIFPYKAQKNRFALDKGGYFSADIYALTIKDENIYSYEFLLQLLNSPIYEFYFKTFAKKLGGDLYEYYPNTLMELFIPDMWKEKIDYEDIKSYFNIVYEDERVINSWIKEK